MTADSWDVEADAIEQLARVFEGSEQARAVVFESDYAAWDTIKLLRDMAHEHRLLHELLDVIIHAHR